MSTYNEQKEVDEAINVANEALYHLEQAKEMLDSAGNWGIVDLLGGGMLTTFLKRSKMSDANKELSKAKDALQRLAKELRDVRGFPEMRIDMGDFLGMADYFFDGAVADWLTQSKISDAKRQVNDAISEVEGILDGLEDNL